MTAQAPLIIIETRIAQLADWLENEAPYAQFDQSHLDAGTPEQAYWHLGYRAALKDALKLLSDEIAGNDDTSNRSPAGDPGA